MPVEININQPPPQKVSFVFVEPEGPPGAPGAAGPAWQPPAGTGVLSVIDGVIQIPFVLGSAALQRAEAFDTAGSADAAQAAADAYTDGQISGLASVYDPLGAATAARDTACAYADTLSLRVIDDRGSFNASVNTFPTSGGRGPAGSIIKGDFWTISVVATSGPLLGFPAGCTMRAVVDSPGQTSSNWALVEVGFGYSPENAANKSTDLYTDRASDIKYPSAKAVHSWGSGAFAAIDHLHTGVYAPAAQGALAVTATQPADAIALIIALS